MGRGVVRWIDSYKRIFHHFELTDIDTIDSPLYRHTIMSLDTKDYRAANNRAFEPAIARPRYAKLKA